MAFIELTLKCAPPEKVTVNTDHILTWRVLRHGGTNINLVTKNAGERDHLHVEEDGEEIVFLIRRYDMLSAKAVQSGDPTDYALRSI